MASLMSPGCIAATRLMFCCDASPNFAPTSRHSHLPKCTRVSWSSTTRRRSNWATKKLGTWTQSLQLVLTQKVDADRTKQSAQQCRQVGTRASQWDTPVTNHTQETSASQCGTPVTHHTQRIVCLARQNESPRSCLNSTTTTPTPSVVGTNSREEDEQLPSFRDSHLVVRFHARNDLLQKNRIAKRYAPPVCESSIKYRNNETSL